MSLPIPLIIKELNDPTSIIPILESIQQQLLNLDKINKTDLKHLVSRTNNLAQSHDQYKKWCGINVIHLLGNNFEVLAQNGQAFFSILLKVLETANPSTDVKIINSTIECLNNLCNNIRGKPALTREILTPKLPSIITLYMNSIEMSPVLVINSLVHIIVNHPTTFRPFGNKLQAKLIEFLSHENFASTFPDHLKDCIYKAFTILPIIEKIDPEIAWQNKLNQVIIEIIDLVSVFKQLLDIDTQDSELINTLEKFTKPDNFQPIFPLLQIDISEPETIYQISNRIEVLLGLVGGLFMNETKNCVQVPMGRLMTVFEIIFSINPKFFPFKRDIRDDLVKDVVNAIIIKNQYNCLKVLSQLPFKFQGSLLLHLNNIISSMETMIPLTNRSIDYKVIVEQEIFFCQLLDTASNLLNLTSFYSDASLLIRFIDAALALVEPRSVSLSSAEPAKSNGKKSKKDKKNSASVPLSDLLSHAHLFQQTIPLNCIKSVRSFILTVLKRSNLPSTQHYKIMRYIIVEAVKSKQYSNDKLVPKELKDLLLSSVIYPGLENTSILPIISSIMGDDPLLSVFNNPRFPPLPKMINSSYESMEADDEDGDEDEDEEKEKDMLNNNVETTESNTQAEEEKSNGTEKRPLDQVESSNKKIKMDNITGRADIQMEDSTRFLIDETKQFKMPEISRESILKVVSENEEYNPPAAQDQTQSTQETSPQTAPQESISTITSTATATSDIDGEAIIQNPPPVDNNDNEDSDFEMPSIDVGDSDED